MLSDEESFEIVYLNEKTKLEKECPWIVISLAYKTIQLEQFLLEAEEVRNSKILSILWKKICSLSPAQTAGLVVGATVAVGCMGRLGSYLFSPS